MNDDLVARRTMRLAAVTYYGKRHLTTGSKAVRSPADMAGFKLRVPPVDVFRAMAEAWARFLTGGKAASVVPFPVKEAVGG
jgi:TRAP-type C4-dicarboxylate transport system substrate-binding protein